MHTSWFFFFFLICLQGAPEMVIKMRKEVKPVMVIEQNGKDFTCTTKTPSSTHVSSFSIGKESEITIMDGRKVKVIQASRYLESVRLILLLSSLSTYIFICTLICYWLLKKKIGFLLSWLTKGGYGTKSLRITTPGNDFFDFEQCTVREENGKLITESDKFTSIKEIQGDDMVDVSGFDFFFLI